jgi:hypothetical protein
LLGINKDLAEVIIMERRVRGCYKDTNDLEVRVKGIGKKTAMQIKGYCSFRSHPISMYKTRQLEGLLKSLLESSEGSSEKRLLHILEYIVARTAVRRHLRWYVDKEYGNKLPSALHDCEWVGILQGKEYYSWLCSAISESKKMIDVAMFHMTLPSEQHPARKLLEGLVDAKKRGVEVKVLLDRDRKDDPYKSTVINSRAKKFLEDNGVVVLSDKPNMLLHSKMVLVDLDIAVIGSHNWTIGSYFEYDDVSVTLKSKSLVEELRARFSKLWKTCES